jgi:beta-lactamase regulating signal transducer with metallopeptidase domain
MVWWIFQSLVTTAALAAMVAVICRFGRIGPVARHALWVVVLVKFLAPPIVVWPWAAPDPLGLARQAEDTDVIVAGVTEVSIREAAELPAAPLPEVPANPASVWPSRESQRESSLPLSTLFIALWIAGSICLLTIEGIRLLRQARRVSNARPADPAIERRVAALASQLGVVPVPVLMMPGATSPVVWCLGRPRLLWPADLGEQSDACIDGLIVHELAHIARRDHLVGWIELLAGVAWWWNPLFWSVRRALREQAELACDAWVISTLPNGRRAYAESLLALSSLGPAPAASIAAVVGVRASSRRVLERRLVMIMKGRAPLRLPWAGLVALVVVASATLPAWASGSVTENGQQPAPAAPPAVAAGQATPVPPAAQQPAQAPVVVPAPAQAKPQPAQPSKAVVQVKPTVAPTPHGTPAPAVHGAVPVDVHQQVTHVLQEKPQPARHVTVAPTPSRRATFTFFPATTELTPEGQKLVEKFDTQREAIQKELDARIEAERQSIIKELQALQDQYAKAGKLDEAVAIRDYLKAGGPANPAKYSWVIRR